MKKHLLAWLLLAPIVLSAQQTYTWNVSSGSWTDPLSWSPQRSSPGKNDILEFSSNTTVNSLPGADSIGRLHIYNNATVNISSPTASAILLGHTDVMGQSFVIEAGATLNIMGTNPITFNIDTGFSGQVSGSIDFAGDEHRLTSASEKSLAFTNGAVFTANTGFVGNAFGSSDTNSVVFENGSSYILKDGGNPFGLPAPAAVTIFNSGSIYRHQVNGVGPSLAGRTYGNIYIEANINFAGIGSHNDCIVQNDFNVLSGFFSFKPNSSGSHTGNFNIYGNISASGTSYIDVGSAYMPGAVQLLGTSQVIGGGGGTGNISLQHLTLNNNSTTLARPLSVSGIFNLQNGKIVTTASSLLTLTATAFIQSCMHAYSNLPYNNIGCDLSYIEGPVQKTGLSGSDFAFPVGVNGKLRPVLLKNATGNFTVSHVRGDPYLEIGSSMGAGIHHISHLEYWTINGTGTAQVELTFFDPNSGGVTDINALRVVAYDGAAWANQGVSSFTGMPGADGSVTSSTVTSFGSFTLASSTDYPNNPLPQKILLWNAWYSRDKITLGWEVADAGLYKGYYVEKSTDGKSFMEISGYIPAKNTNESKYYIYDHNINTGKNWYRLKIIGVDGAVFFSEIKTFEISYHDELIVYPNPAREKIFIKIPGSRSISDLAIVNISGSVVKWVSIKRQTTVAIDILNLLPGIYFIKSAQLPSPVIVKFVKF